MIVAGNLTLNGNSVPVAQYDYESSSWNTFASSTSDGGLPGAASAISYDDKTKKTYIVGQYENATTYLRVWDGAQFTVPGTDDSPANRPRRLTYFYYRRGARCR